MHRRAPHPALLLLLALAAGGAGAPALEGQTGRQGTVRGQVVDESTGEGVRTVEVQFMDGRTRILASTLTDADGWFTLGPVASGPFRLRVIRIGYERVITPYWTLGAGDILTVTIRVHPEVLLLAPLEVVARSRSSSPVLSGFYERADRAVGGTFFQRQDIERIAPTRVSDLLTQVPGVRLEGGGTGTRRTVTMARSLPGIGGGACPVQVFLDGVLATRGRAGPDGGVPIDELVNVSSLEGMEVYRGLSTVPGEFITPEARCGVIALWTRRGG